MNWQLPPDACSECNWLLQLFPDLDFKSFDYAILLRRNPGRWFFHRWASALVLLRIRCRCSIFRRHPTWNRLRNFALILARTHNCVFRNRFRNVPLEPCDNSQAELGVWSYYYWIHFLTSTMSHRYKYTSFSTNDYSESKKVNLIEANLGALKILKRSTFIAIENMVKYF